MCAWMMELILSTGSYSKHMDYNIVRREGHKEKSMNEKDKNRQEHSTSPEQLELGDFPGKTPTTRS